MYCNNCGSKCPDDSMFCQVCGTRIGQDSLNPAPAPQPVTPKPVMPPEKKNSSALIILISVCILAIALLVTALIIFVFNRDNPDPSPTTTDISVSSDLPGSMPSSDQSTVPPTPVTSPTDTTTSTTTTTTATTTTNIDSEALYKGDTVYFGGIEWVVLDVRDNRALIITKNITERKKYNNTIERVTWETCTLRSYLNGEWYNRTFSSYEKSRIETTYVVNSNNPQYGTYGGNNTYDKVFLLSIDEMLTYFPSKESMIASYNGEAGWWWLRSPGYSGTYAACIFRTGGVDYGGGDSKIGSNVDNNGRVRPAMWISF